VGRIRSLKGGIGKLLPALAFFVALAACPVLAIVSTRGGVAPGAQDVSAASSAANFGMLLFTKYQLLFELTGFLLLAAMVGVIYISARAPAAETSKAAEAGEK
jgi:NADH:ubiquinone oxidoreductase subunit 6 (subunit J)